MIIVNSKAGRNILEQGGYKMNKAIVIPNGIDTEKYRVNKKQAGSLRQKWGADPQTKIVGMVARIDPIKDHETFLRAAHLLCQRRDDLRFVCVGAGDKKQTDHLRAMTADLGLGDKVVWAGSIDAMPTVYSAFDVAVLCSSGEGFANVIGEAMACQTPCVVTDVGDLAWIVGDTGIVVPARQPEKLADGITCMLEKIAATPDDPGRMARKRIESMFSATRLVDRTSQELDKLV